MKVVALVLLFVGIVTCRPDPNVVDGVPGADFLTVKWMGSDGVVCNEGNTQKVGDIACGGASSVSESATGAPAGTEFAFLLDCKDSDTSLGQCGREQKSPSACSGVLQVTCSKKRESDFFGIL